MQETLGWEEFEDICCSFLYLQGHKNIKKAGKVKDRGRDAVTLIDKQERVIFQFSKEKNPLRRKTSKFYKEYKKWQESKEVEEFIFVSNQDLGSKKIDLEKSLKNPSVQIFDITNLVNFLDYDSTGQKIKKNYAIFEKDLQEIFGAEDKLNKLDKVAKVINKDENYKITTVLSEPNLLDVGGVVFSISSGQATQLFTPKSKKHYEKAVPRGSFKLKFPKTKAGTEMFKKYQKTVKSGDSILIPPEYVSDLQLRLGSKLIFDGGGKKVSISIKTVKENKPISHILRPTNKPELFVLINLYIVKSGTDEVTFDNHRENSPLDLKIIYKVSQKKVKLSYSFHPERCYDADEAFKYLRLLNEFNTNSLELIFDDRGIERRLIEIPSNGNLSLPKNYLNILQKISRIQQTFKTRLPNPLNRQLSKPDLWSIEKLSEIISSGKTKISIKNLSFCMNNDAVKKMEDIQQVNKTVAMSFDCNDGFKAFSLLGLFISPSMKLVLPKGKIIKKQPVNKQQTQIEVKSIGNAYLVLNDHKNKEN